MLIFLCNRTTSVGSLALVRDLWEACVDILAIQVPRVDVLRNTNRIL